MFKVGNYEDKASIIKTFNILMYAFLLFVFKNLTSYLLIIIIC